MKIWHDDIRRPPDDTWFWARTNDQAKWIFQHLASQGKVAPEISLDHDLGCHDLDPDAPDAIYQKGNDEETGLKLARWLCDEHPEWIPRKITIHSWNPDGAKEMANTFSTCKSDKLQPGIILHIKPYQKSKIKELT